MAKTPSKSATKVIKVSKNSKPVSGKSTRKKKSVETYSRYIFKVLKEVHPNTGMSKKGMSVMNSFISDIFERIATEAKELASHQKKKTLFAHDVQLAARLVLPGELAKHAVSEGTRANAKFQSF